MVRAEEPRFRLSTFLPCFGSLCLFARSRRACVCSVDNGHARGTCSFAYKLCYYFFSFRCSKCRIYVVFCALTENTSATFSPKMLEFPEAFSQAMAGTSGTDRRQFALMAERDTDLMSSTFFCRPSEWRSSLSANFIRVISFVFIHFVHFSLNDGSCRWLRHQFRLRHYFLCVRAFCPNGYSSVHLKWCRTRQTELHFISFFSVHLLRLSAAQLCRALLHDSKIKCEKWKPKHINNYGSEPERQSESAGTGRAFLGVLSHFFAGDYTCTQLLTVAIHNK